MLRTFSIISLVSVELLIAQNPTAGLAMAVPDQFQGDSAMYTCGHIVRETDASFVAPVVPVSPENKVYLSNRVYMAFFKPKSDQYWYGNLKKYGLDGSGNILDKNGSYANYVDEDGNLVDDRNGDTLPQGAHNGSFRASSQSYWSSLADAGTVNEGGAGVVLKDRNFSLSCATCDITGLNPRQIYTYLGTDTDLTNDGNAFSTKNPLITAAALGLPGPIIASGTSNDVKQLINFIHGFDVYGDDGTKKRAWLLGDILHSKPYVLNYAPYMWENEANCFVNQTIIYVGSNDGMLHAFRDCDGSEAWAFIPPDLLPVLQYLKLTGDPHTYFVDSTISAYIYDENNDGIQTGSSSHDKTVLIIGLRRGGGTTSSPSTGFYYALDVTDWAKPKYLWKISRTTPGFAQLGEAWSEPKIIKIKTGSRVKVAAIIGGGYDNCYEDSRFGATQTFSGACVGSIFTNDGGLNPDNTPKTSAGSIVASDLTNYQGRAIYAVEIASLDASGNPIITTRVSSPLMSHSRLEYSLLSEIAAIDTNFDGYADRLYAGDAGGNLWRFDINGENLNARKIFSSNPLDPSDVDRGRKIFYKPSVTIDSNYLVRIYFGTGDREHPLNRAVTDRLYEIIDKGQTNAVTEAKLVEVTEDKIQAGASSEITTVISKLNLASDPANTQYYGWCIRLDQHPGEKVLAPATVCNKAVYFTTYAPNTSVMTEPCEAGSLGTSRIYVVDYNTGAAVVNYDKENDGQYDSYKTNSYATPASGGQAVLLRADREKTIGSGMSSGVVIAYDKAFVGCGGGICTTSTAKPGSVLPVYWRRR